MEWWIISALATVATLGTKGYFTRAVERTRLDLTRQQREALHIKESLTNTRNKHQLTLRHNRDTAATIKRLTVEIRSMEDRVKKLPKKHS
jgi:septal ring factor EnvC (AmiA/AmiB activator)